MKGLIKKIKDYKLKRKRQKLIEKAREAREEYISKTGEEIL